jgi:hypothetical protein
MNQKPGVAEAGRTPDLGFRVVVFGPPTDREALLRELRRELGLHPVDSRIHVRHLPGILPDRLDREDAERVADAIRRIGGDVAVIPADDWPDLSRAPTVHHVRCTDCGLEVVSQAGTSAELIPWEHLRLISVADVPLDGVRHFVAPRTTVIRVTPRIKDARLETRTVRGAEMWIVCENPFRAFRIDHREMNYEYLGGSLTGSAAVNFEVFLKDIVQHAPHAQLTPVARAYIKRAPAEQWRYVSAEEHRTRVQLAAARLKSRSALEEPSTTDSSTEEAP